MPNNQQQSFEMEFLAYFVKATSNPATLKKSKGEMQAILNRIRAFKSPTELQAALDSLRAYIPLDSTDYPSANDAIRAVERSLVKVVLHSEESIKERLRDLANETYTSRVKTSDKHHNAAMDFIKS